MRIGVLELLSAGPAIRWDQKAFGYLVTRQYASIMPQAISVWCRNLNHEVFYATYFGNGDPKTLLPEDLDVVFISTYTQASALAYALAKLYRREKTLTVIGGPHAKQFPEDCMRFFDVVVGDCDKTLINEILKDKPRGEFVTSGRSITEVPGVRERITEICSAAFFRGKAFRFSLFPILTSTGCPNSCDFCVDWNNPYRLLPLDQLEADMRYIYQNFPNVTVGFHDPNFAVKFEQLFDILEGIPNRKRNLYVIESSLSVLQPSRLERMKNLGDFCIVPGIESWTGYSNKMGAVSSITPRQKLDNAITRLNIINQYVAGIQVNFMFGLDADAGDEPVSLMKEFADRAPFVMPNFNIPVPFGNTPMYSQYAKENRILTAMPFTFYYMPYLVFTPKNYDPLSFYTKLRNLYSYIFSKSRLLKELAPTAHPVRSMYNPTKILGNRQMIGRLRRLSELLANDRQFSAFHLHKTDTLPEFYHRQYEATLGPYASLMSREDRIPFLAL